MDKKELRDSEPLKPVTVGERAVSKEEQERALIKLKELASKMKKLDKEKSDNAHNK